MINKSTRRETAQFIAMGVVETARPKQQEQLVGALIANAQAGLDGDSTQRLRQHGLVTGMRGPGGGYCLARPAAEITIARILATVDDVSRREEMPHTQGETPVGAQMWLHLSNRIYDYLDSITLEEAVTSAGSDTQAPMFNSGFSQTAA